MTNLRNGGRKLSQGQKKRLREQTEKAVQAALLEHDKLTTKPYQVLVGGMETDSFLMPSVEAPHSGLFVHNWRDGWRWFSNVALTAIVAVNAVPIPPEVINALPPHAQASVTIGLAVVGVLGRFINQARNKALPPIDDKDVAQ